MTSLRRRIFIGSVLWTIGMIMLSAAVFTVVVEVHPLPVHISNVHGTIRAPLTLVFGAGCLVIGALQVRRGLMRVDALRSRLAGRATCRQLQGPDSYRLRSVSVFAWAKS